MRAMRTYWKNSFLIVCIVYTTLSLIYFVMNGDIPVKVTALFLGMALFSSLLGIILIPNERHSNRRIIFNQVIYLLTIMAAIIIVSYLAGWQQSFLSITVNGGIVLGLFVVVKYFLYSTDKKEAATINAELLARKERRSDSL